MHKIVIERPNDLRDSLVNCCTDCTHGNFLHGNKPAMAYGQGIIAGMVGLLISQGMDYHDAIKLVKSYTPTQHTCMGYFDENCVPITWVEDWRKA